ncbi:S-adenosyl-L-methionine-dependent methyltransferase [Xylaria bambusicola]|uniref:S-adenosyl-L-methionine-dependent methyltransferase n=1 Tax=Xylaria bambusicola TaxID=326684 RepID=UPI0020072D90|nr:S-adenosyl-L-methionine-dependent methyltransferase [Xylaria bambusicola]KAI0517242.1 S-adenosyl-L-methionine-dependent methyltransferase [Xylaria bambusicola]
MEGGQTQSFQGVAYQPQEDVYFDDGREHELLQFVLNHPKVEQLKRNPQKVLDVIDEFGRTKKYLMNIGEYKSKTVVELIKDRKPQVMVELGGYVGYSAIAFAAALRECGGSVYYSLEKSPEFGKVIMNLADLAGLGEVIRVVVGPSSDSLRRLHADGSLTQIDLLFLDHYKPLYTQDLKICEELGLVKVGTVLAADNVIKPGNPPYLEYVRSSVEKKNEDLTKITESDLKGNPNLIYESRLVEGWEPSGVPDAVEVTKCVGVHS